MGTRILQPSFAAGEISPSLHGRVDLAKYQVAVEELQNMYVYPYGGASNRPGFKYLNDAADAGSRLIPFVYSVDIAYIIELFVSEGSTYFRIMKEESFLQSGDPLEDIIIELYDEELDLSLIKYSQSGNLLYLTTTEVGVFKIYREPLDELDWTAEEVDFEPGLEAPSAPTVSKQGGGADERYYVYVVTRFNEDTLQESLPSDPAQVQNEIVLTVSKYNRIRISSTDDPSAITGYNVYKLYNGLFGWISYAKNTYSGTGAAVNIDVNDDGIAADISDTPPRDTTAFGGYKPEAVGFHKQRSVFGYGQTVWLSKIGNYENMSSSYPLKANDPMDLTIASNMYNNIRNFVSMNDLIVFTSGGEFVISSEGALTPTSASVKQLSYWGSSRIQPIVAGNIILFIDRTNKSVRDLIYSQEIDGFLGNDISLLIPHRLRDYYIVDWAFQQKPNSIVWCVRNDGALLGLTYMKEQEVFAWHYHETQGEVKSIASIPGDNGKDDIYIAVERENGTFIEKLMPSVIEHGIIIDCFYLDSGLTYDGSLYGVSADASIELSALTGDSIDIESDEDVFLEAMIGRKITVNGKGIAKITGYTDAKNITAKVETTFERSTFDPGNWYITATTLSGLSHLEGQELGVFGDGSVLPEVIVDGGEVTVSRPVSVCTVGLKYTSKLKTLGVEIQTESGSSQGLFKNINKVILKVELSRGFSAGCDENNLVDMKIPLQNYGTPQELYTGTWELNIQTKWNKKGSILIQQDNPIPLNILSIVPEVNIGI